MSKRPTDIPGLQQVSIETIYPHVFGSRDKEVGGVLVGRKPNHGFMPLITGAIAAISADEQRATLTFTQETWEYIHRTIESDYPDDEEIVGWYHSHPDFGIFLSDHDLFIHRNFFSGESQIAVVVDPVNRTEGVFAWRDDDITKLFEQPTPEGFAVESSTQLVVATPVSETRVIFDENTTWVAPHSFQGAPVAPAPVQRRGRSAGLLAGIIGAGLAVVIATLLIAVSSSNDSSAVTPQPNPEGYVQPSSDPTASLIKAKDPTRADTNRATPGPIQSTDNPNIAPRGPSGGRAAPAPSGGPASSGSPVPGDGTGTVQNQGSQGGSGCSAGSVC